MIKPTNGRIVLFTPNVPDPDVSHRIGVALAAMVVKVWGDRLVNLVVFDEDGKAIPKTSVTLLQDGDEAPATGFYAAWMPYQVGQAAKAAAAEFPAAVPVLDANGKKVDGPTVAQFVAAGYNPANYPPAGYASRSTDDEIAAAQGAFDDAAAALIAADEAAAADAEAAAKVAADKLAADKAANKRSK